MGKSGKGRLEFWKLKNLHNFSAFSANMIQISANTKSQLTENMDGLYETKVRADNVTDQV